ncbi:MFS transporter [Planomonospora venezuelensis]|uniref:MFS transporter n=1 Tax=Planomonospora venezuelensis TaxID=1999 RepID=A0A841DDN0_PLAVE|nr:MFS transporter [Planomonospora venezuelensis]MBB5966408.1 hypothetical protein [Planomonospora venezuelensis]
MRARLPLRLVRSAAFAAVCVALAVLGHVAAGGSGPQAWAVAAGTAAAVITALSLAGRERSARTVNVALTGAQLVLHELFALGGPSGISLTAHPHGQGLGESLGMLLAHLTATLVTGWWLARGETALWAVLRSAGHHLAAAGHRAGAAFLLLQAPSGPPAAPPAAAPGAVPVPVRPLLRHIVSRRGPPLPAA